MDREKEIQLQIFDSILERVLYGGKCLTKAEVAHAISVYEKCFEDTKRAEMLRVLLTFQAD